MSSVVLVALLAAQGLAAAQFTVVAENRTGDRSLPLISRGTEAREHCTTDGRWCVGLTEPDERGAVRPVLRASGASGAAPGQPSGEPAEEPSSDTWDTVWPVLLALRDGSFLAGVEARTRTSYSGGGGSAAALRLFHLSPDGTAGAGPILEAPLAASLMIRSCFSEADMRKRRGACHDEYGFSARIEPAPGTVAGRPDLTYTTEAWAFPRGVSRSADSTQRALRPGDLVRQRDAACSVRRRFRFDAATGAYRPDRPLPDCSDYTIP